MRLVLVGPPGSGKGTQAVRLAERLDVPQAFPGDVQNFQFTTPQNVSDDQRCGKVVFSDMHVASGSSSNAGAGTPFPSQCSTTPLSAQEKALAFIFFDISSCVGSIF